MTMSGSRCAQANPRLLAGLLAVLALLLAPAIPAATLVKGQVLDQAAGAGIAGVTLEARQGERVLGTVNSGPEGSFTLALDVGTRPEPQVVTLLARHPDFADLSKNLAIARGEPDSPFYTLEMLPAKLAPCRVQQGQGVVIGYFRSPASEQPYHELSSRIADALTYAILPRLQELHLPGPDQPLFLECDAARPRTLTSAGALARALGAVAFVSGDVKQESAGYRVSSYVGDRFDLFVPPLRSVSERVDLDDPGAARLDPAMHAAILTAVAASLEAQKKYAECIDASIAAERAIGRITPAIKQYRERCQGQVANRGLLPGTATAPGTGP